MNRRSFLHTMLAAGAAPAIVKVANIMPIFVRREAAGLFVPSGNMLLTPSLFAREALKIFHENLLFTQALNKDCYFMRDGEFGHTIKIRRPKVWTTPR